jgi:hypothetical protein
VGGTGSESPAHQEPPLEKEPFRFFAPTSFWNTPLPSDTPIDAQSGPLIERLATVAAQEVATTGGPAINTTAFSVPVYTVGPGQPTVKVALRESSGSTALRSAWSAVPLPPEALPAAGTDRHLVVWQPSTDKLWEFWRLGGGPGSWEAGWGGAMERVSQSSGVYGPTSWPGATRWWGASASSISIEGGLISLEDVAAGKIDHALAMAVPDVRARVYSLPAKRSDGRSLNRLSLPEGARLRLDPDLNLAGLRIPRITRLIAQAAQRYGLIVRDGASNVSLYAEDPTPIGTNPYIDPPYYFEGIVKPLAPFPWHHLQLLKMKLRPNR